MRSALQIAAVATLLSLPAAGIAQPAASQSRGEGTIIVITGSGEVEVANDEAVAQFYVELQDADLARAQSLVNQKAADGVAQIKRADPQAQVETGGYASYPIHARDNARKIVAWRVRQSVSVRTGELASLPRLVSVAQQNLALGGLDFRLSRAGREKVEAELIRRAIANANARIGAAAQALDVPKSRVHIEELNFGGGIERPPIVPMARAMAQSSEAVAEPQLDAGRSVQQLTVTARVRFLPG